MDLIRKVISYTIQLSQVYFENYFQKAYPTLSEKTMSTQFIHFNKFAMHYIMKIMYFKYTQDRSIDEANYEGIFTCNYYFQQFGNLWACSKQNNHI